MGASCCSNNETLGITQSPQRILSKKSAVFQDSNVYCKSFPDDVPITQRCSHTMRLCTALLYFEALKACSTIEDEEKRQRFIAFNEEIYDFMMDDIAHFIKEHERDIKRVQREWTKQYGLLKCSVSDCAQTERHYARGRRDEMKKRECVNEDALYSFYESLYDRMHHFIFHLYETGLRVDVSSLNLSEDTDDEKEAKSSGVTVDEVFAAERDRIKTQRKQCNVDFQSLDDGQSKFTIQHVQEQQGVTLTDAIFDKLRLKLPLTSQHAILGKVQAFLRENSFDSDAMEMDLMDPEESNIYALSQDGAVFDRMKTFIQTINMRRAAFSTGFEFKYEEARWGDRPEEHVIYVKHDTIMVKSKYKNLKEEILESGYLSHSEWLHFVDLKGRKYWNSETVKKMKKQREHLFEMALEHIFAIILYCDFSALCTAFSRTFRRENVFENVESVVLRHSEFGHFGRLLVEVVHLGGITRTRGNGAHEAEPGPFFCGINCLLNIGSFSITLKGPCSTSTVKEVAMNFAKDQGMILKLNNDTKNAQNETFFDCSWISNYPEEQERLWIAGSDYRALRMVSITLVESAKNYSEAMRAFYLFDAMISAVNLYEFEKKALSKDHRLIAKLLNWTLSGGNAGDLAIDSFIKNEWSCFLLRERKVIKLHLLFLHKYYHSLSDLVMFNVVNNRNEIANGKDNVLRPEWLSMFPSVDTVIINTFGGDFNFSLEGFVQFCLQSVSQNITIMIYGCIQWIAESREKRAFEDAGWSIEFLKSKDENDSDKWMIKSK